MCTYLKIDEPISFQKAIDSLNQKEWIDVMRDKMDSMATNMV